VHVVFTCIDEGYQYGTLSSYIAGFREGVFRLKTSVSGGMHVPCGPPTVSCFANAWKHVPAGKWY
jgi:hypothetical protein